MIRYLLKKKPVAFNIINYKSVEYIMLILSNTLKIGIFLKC